MRLFRDSVVAAVLKPSRISIYAQALRAAAPSSREKIASIENSGYD